MFCLVDKKSKKVVYVGFYNRKFPNSEDVESLDTLIEWGTLKAEDRDNVILEKWSNEDDKTAMLRQQYKEFTAIYDEEETLIRFEANDMEVPQPQPVQASIEERLTQIEIGMAEILGM